jgi:hypothetical protein
MLKHRLARRLSTLFMLVAVLVAVASAPAASAKGPFCEREITHEGCVEICCTGAGCMVAPCN